MDVVEKRADDPFTEADILAQDKIRKRWFMDQVFSDTYSSVQIPFEVHSFWNAAPVVKFYRHNAIGGCYGRKSEN